MFIFVTIFCIIVRRACCQQPYDEQYNNAAPYYYTTLAPTVPPTTQAYITQPSTIATTIATTTTTIPPTHTEKLPFIPKLITYWGQNAAEDILGTKESSLTNLCGRKSPYSTIIIGYVNKFSDEDNLDELPGMSFSIHCKKSISDKYRSLLYCPEIANDIRFCHERGIKILIGIGGPNSPSYFENDLKAERFAKNIWNLFLGGDEMPDLRPFGSVVMDGINMFMEPPTKDIHHDHVFLMTLHNLRKTDLARIFLLTLSPSCLFPDPYFGPAPDKILQNSISLIDQIYIRYSNPNCCSRGSFGFRKSISSWKNFVSSPSLKGIRIPELFIGIPATESSAVIELCYRSPKEVSAILQSLQAIERFRGVAIIDNAFDFQDVDVGFTFSKELLQLTLPRNIKELTKYKPILSDDDGKSMTISDDDIHDDEETILEEPVDHKVISDNVTVTDTEDIGDMLVHIKPTEPIVIVTTPIPQTIEIIRRKTTLTPVHNNKLTTGQELNDNDLMEIQADQDTDDDSDELHGDKIESNEDHDNQQDIIEKAKEQLLSNATVLAQHENQLENKEKEDDNTDTVDNDDVKFQDNINKGTGEQDIEESNENELLENEDEEKGFDDDRIPPKNDHVPNSQSVLGETPEGMDMDDAKAQQAKIAHAAKQASEQHPDEISQYEVNVDTTNEHVEEHEHEIENVQPVQGEKTPLHEPKYKVPDTNTVFDKKLLLNNNYQVPGQTPVRKHSSHIKVNAKKHAKLKSHEIKNPSDDFIIPFWDRELPTNKPTAVSGKKNWKNKRMKKFHNVVKNVSREMLLPFWDHDLPTVSPTAVSGKKNWKNKRMRKFHNGIKNATKEIILPFWDRELPTVSPTAVAGKKNWKNKTFKKFHSSSKEDISDDLLDQISSRDFQIIAPTKLSGKTVQAKKKFKKFHDVSKKICDNCLKLYATKCPCKDLKSKRCKTCRKQLKNKCNYICKRVVSLLEKVNDNFNSTVEKEYLSNKFKNYSKIMLDKRLRDDAISKMKIKKYKFLTNSSLSNKNSLITGSNTKSSYSNSYNNSAMEEVSSAKGESDSKTTDTNSKTAEYNSNQDETSKRLENLRFYHVPEMLRKHDKLTTNITNIKKLNTLKIKKKENKLKFDHISSEIKDSTALSQQIDNDKVKRLNLLNFDCKNHHNFPVSKETHKKLLQFNNVSKVEHKLNALIVAATQLIKNNTVIKSEKNKNKTETNFLEKSQKKESQQKKIENSDKQKIDKIDNQEISRGSDSGTLSSIPKMYDDLKNFIVDDMAQSATNDLQEHGLHEQASGEEIEYLHDGDPLTAIYDEDGSNSGETDEEDIVYFYPDGSLNLNSHQTKTANIQGFANAQKGDPSTFWSNDYEHRIPNLVDPMKQASNENRSPDNELKIPNVFNPMGNANPPTTHGAQMEENSKYMKLLQDDIQRQVNIFNKEIVDEQPFTPESIESNTTEPLRLPEEELQKLIELKNTNLFENNAANNELVEEENIMLNNNAQNDDVSKKSTQEYVSNYVKPQTGLKKLIEYSNNNNKGFLSFKDFNFPKDKLLVRDLVGNVNVKGNMAQLKLLMAEMQRNIDDSNAALQEKQKQDEAEANEKENDEKKNKEEKL